MLEQIVIYFAAVMIILTIIVFIFVMRCRSISKENETLMEMYDDLLSDYGEAIEQKKALSTENSELHADNVRLADAVRALNKENNELYTENERLKSCEARKNTSMNRRHYVQ